MRLVEGSVESVELIDFAERATAFAAIVNTYGENHPLTTPSQPGTAEHTLYDDLQRGDQATPFDGEDAQAIVTAVEALAVDRQDPTGHQPMAKKMISTLLGQPAAEIVEVRAESPVKAAEPEKEAVLPPPPEGFATQERVILRGLGEMIAMLRASEEFGDRDDQGQSARSQLRAEIARQDPLSAETSLEYVGHIAMSLYESALRAGRRDKSVTDAQAGRLVELGRVVTEIESPQPAPAAMAAGRLRQRAPLPRTLLAR